MAFLNYIGQGVEYPIEAKSGAFKIITGHTLLESSMIQILNIPEGSLPHNPYFGSKLFRLLHQPLDVIVISSGITFIAEALAKWERRVKVLDVEGETSIQTVTENGFESTQSFVNFVIEYRILSSNEVASFVYPFYTELEF